MTTQETKLFFEGKGYWYEYVRVNGYAFHPTEKGLSKLSKLLDINVPHLRKCINIFLSA
jgi:hypothetical protein